MGTPAPPPSIPLPPRRPPPLSTRTWSAARRPPSPVVSPGNPPGRIPRGAEPLTSLVDAPPGLGGRPRRSGTFFWPAGGAAHRLAEEAPRAGEIGEEAAARLGLHRRRVAIQDSGEAGVGARV